MPLTSQESAPYVAVLESLYEDATYSAQTYFEAAKRAELWGKVVVFLPAIIAAFAGIVVALGWDKTWGVVSATAGLVAATGSFLGAERKAPSYKDSARRYTQLRHEIRLARNLVEEYESKDELRTTTRALVDSYKSIVSRDEPAPNRSFSVADKRINAGIMTTQAEGK